MLEHSDVRAILAQCEFNNWTISTGADGTRQYLQVTFIAPCNVTGDRKHHSGRKWFLSPHMTRSEVVSTAFMAVKAAVEHETREQFLYRGQAVFGPHWDLDWLAEKLANNPTRGADARAAA